MLNLQQKKKTKYVSAIIFSLIRDILFIIIVSKLKY